MTQEFNSGTQYGDIHGNITIDNAHNSGLHEFAEEFSVDTDRYFPIGIDIYIGDNSFVNISIIAVDTTISNDYDNIRDYFNNNDIVDVKEFTLKNATLDDYLKHCKRLNIRASLLPELMGKTINIT